MTVAEDAGRYGHALRFAERNEHAVFYRANGNIGYSPERWSGTVSFWLRVDPATDLAPGFTDPVQITDAAYNDAAIWVDFTGENPRQFRLGVFGDLAVWNPDGIGPNENPAFADRLTVVDDWPFARRPLDARGGHLRGARSARWRRQPVSRRRTRARRRGRHRLSPSPGTSTAARSGSA